MELLKRIAAKLPDRWQTELKRMHFGRQIMKDNFVTDEPEYKLLQTFIKPGDWVLDVGANIGHYTKRFSDLVGEKGRVIAFEPVPTTFALLSANVQLFTNANVSLINAAVSDKLDLVGMSMPKFSTGLTDFYSAQITSENDNDFSVLSISLDSLNISQRITLVKIDVEGHEASVLAGMENLIKKYHPVLIIETESDEVINTVSTMGYNTEKLKDSPNVLFKPSSII